jgi:hypothetical protein
MNTTPPRTGDAGISTRPYDSPFFRTPRWMMPTKQ